MLDEGALLKKQIIKMGSPENTNHDKACCCFGHKINHIIW